MADAIITNRTALSETLISLQVTFAGADLLANPTRANTTATITTSDNAAQIMAAFAAAVRALSASINKAGGGSGVTVPANRVLDLPSLSRG